MKTGAPTSQTAEAINTDRRHASGTPARCHPHTLLEGFRFPGVFFIRFLRVRPEEVSILLWVRAIQVTMSISSVLINNLSQATFLKRFGVGYLPAVFLAESVVTFLVANAVGVSCPGITAS